MYKMNFKKIALLLVFTVFCSVNLFAENVRIIVDITNVVVNDGKVYLAIFFNADEFRREEPSMAFQLDSSSTVLSHEIFLPPGEYLISAFQDSNNNQKLDTNLLGVPRELVGLSNYSGRGFPSKNFDRHKVPVNSSTGKITVGLYKF